MGQLLTDTVSIIRNIQTEIDDVLSKINDFTTLYNTDYILGELKDADYLKELMINKVELGVKSYDIK